MADHITNGEKAARVRRAIQLTINEMPDTAHKPRHDLRELLNGPSMMLALLHDKITEEVCP